MGQRIGVSALALTASLSVTGASLAQTSPPPPPADVPAPAITIPAIEVTAERLNRERSSILPSLGATQYDFSRTAISNTPQGQNAPLNQVLLRAPGA